MFSALLWTLITALFFATISATISFLARDRMSSFNFFTIVNLAASLIAWIVLPDWSMASQVDWGMLFAFTLITGGVNTASQAMLVLTLKLGHNGLTVAIRNLAAVISIRSLVTLFQGSCEFRRGGDDYCFTCVDRCFQQKEQRQP